MSLSLDEMERQDGMEQERADAVRNAHDNLVRMHKELLVTLRDLEEQFPWLEPYVEEGDHDDGEY